MQIIRHGAYGILIKDSKILLTQKRKGPYQGLWGLPGGAMEFGETPEETLKRELLEETALQAGPLQFFQIATAKGTYSKNGEPYKFHQVGLIYKVQRWSPQAHRKPEEENRWVALSEIVPKELTPFAKHATAQLAPQQTWRPPQNVRGKVIALLKRNNQLLVAEVLDDAGKLKGYCPLGGGINFGEFAENAIRREMLEELGCSIHLQGAPIVFENLYEHHGSKGHEIIFAFPLSVDKLEIYAQNRFEITEERGSKHFVEWIDIEAFKTGSKLLFPEQLKNHL